MFKTYLHNILKYENINFHAKIAQNLQILKNCTYRSRNHIHACNTGFESPEHILFSSEKFGYHFGTVRTQEIQISILLQNLPKLDRLNPQMEFHRKMWYPKFYIQKVQGLSFSTPCQPSP